MKRSCSVCGTKDHRRVKVRKPKKGRNKQPILAHHACVPVGRSPRPRTRPAGEVRKATPSGEAKGSSIAQAPTAPKRRRLLRRKKDDG